jgi:hypothetical protein
MAESKSTENVQQIQVRVPDSVGAGVYANIVKVNASNNEVVLDFILSVPNQGQAIMSSRVIISLPTAQQLSEVLEALLRHVKTLSKEK